MKSSGQSIKIVFFLLVSLCFAFSAFGSNNAWLRLQAQRFGVLSQLSESNTKKFAEEFDKFIDVPPVFPQVIDTQDYPKYTRFPKRESL